METARTATDEAATPPPAAVPPVSAANDAGLIETAQALWQDVRDSLHDYVQLALLEAQRTGKSLVSIVVYGIAAAILAFSAWLGLLAAGMLWLIALGLVPSVAALVVVGINLVGVGVLVMLIMRATHFLGFPATVRSLKSDASLVARKET